MNLLKKIIFVVILFSSKLAISTMIEEFYEEKTGHTISIYEASNLEQDVSNAKQFSKHFFRFSYDLMPKEDKEFDTIDELVEENFKRHKPFIDNKTYKFITVKNQDNMIGYALFDVFTDQKQVSFIECQADIITYPIENLMPMIIDVIKNNYAHNVSQLYALVRKAMPAFAAILLNAGYRTCDFIHPRITNPAEYYNEPSLAYDERLLSLKEKYQGYVYQINQ